MNRFSTAIAIASAIRRERRNLMWRFSRIKAGAWFLLFQAAAVGAVFYNFSRSGAALPFSSALAAVAAQGALWGAISVFIQERDRLYRNRIAELVHISPAPAFSLPLASLIADLPSRAWTSFVWAGMFAGPAATWWSLPALWLAGLLLSLAAQLAATRLLVAVVRWRPKFLMWMWALSLAGTVIFTAAVAYLLFRPQLLQGVAGRLVPLAAPLAALLLLAGGGIGLAAVLKPERLGELYREGWLHFSESSRTTRRQSGSQWPAVMPGPSGSIQAKDWLLIRRNPLSWVRFGALAVIVIALALLRPWLATLAPQMRQAAAQAVPFGAALFILGEAVAASFPAERDKLTLYTVAGSSAAHLILGKALAAMPVVPLTAGLYVLSGWVFSVGVDAGAGSLGSVTGLLWEGTLSGVGMAAILIGMGAVEAPRHFAGFAVDDAYQQMFEQVPTGIFSQAGLLLAALFGAVRVWGSPLLEAMAWLLPLAALGAGWLRLARFFRFGRTR